MLQSKVSRQNLGRQSRLKLVLPHIILVCLWTLSLAPPRLLGADIAPVESMLDRLEKRLLDQEADGLGLGSPQNDPAFLSRPEQTPSKRYKFKGAKVEGMTPEGAELKSIEASVSELETQVDQLASAVHKTRQSLLDEAKIDNFVAIDANLNGGDQLGLRSLNVTLDGYAVYDLSEAQGFWLPTSAWPLYGGPLQPGNHKLVVSARLVVRERESLPLNGDVFRIIDKSFDLEVPTEVKSRRYVLAISPSTKLEASADVTLKEVP